MKHLLGLILVVALLGGLLVAYVLRLRRERAQPPGPLTCGEAMSRLGAAHLSLAAKREVASQLEGQRVRWTGTFREVFRTRGTWTVLCTGDVPKGVYKDQFFFDPAGADRGRLERMAEGTRLVVEGTLRIDLDHDLVNLEAPVVRFDLEPSA